MKKTAGGQDELIPNFLGNKLLFYHMTETKRSSNDQRSDVHNLTSSEYKASVNNHSNQANPTSSAYTSAMNNRSNQMNPNNPSYSKSRSK